MFKYLRGRPGSADAALHWRRLAQQARIYPVTVDGQYQRFVVHVPCWPYTLRRRLRDGQARYAFLHLIDERIRLEIVEPAGASEETLVLWRKRAEERHTVQRRLVGRWGATIFEWHVVRHA